MAPPKLRDPSHVARKTVEEKDQQNPVTKEMDIDLWRETQNPSTKKNPTHKTGLGTTLPQEKLNEEDDERTESNEPRE
jgi:hypothetical protein